MKPISPSLSKYIINVGLLAIAWYAFSFCVEIMLAGEHDSLNITNQSPTLLETLSSVTYFPAFYFGNWDGAPKGFADREFAILGLAVLGINSLIWGLFLGGLLHLVSKR